MNYGRAALGTSGICLLQSLLTLLLIILAIGLMLRIITPREAFKHLVAAFAFVAVFVVLALTLYTLWSALSFVAQAGLIVIGIFLWRRKRHARKGKEE
jgi:predicted membrane protein